MNDRHAPGNDAHKVNWSPGCGRRIVRGDLAPGDRLPTRTQLVGRLGASTGTIQGAIDCLVEDGFLEAGPTGTFVAARPPHLTDLTILFHSDPKHNFGGQQFYLALFNEAQRFAAETRRRVDAMMGVEWTSSRDFDRFRENLEAHRLAGVIHTSPPDIRTAELLRRHRGVPQAAIMLAGEESVPAVSVDFESFYRTAIEQLRLAGCRRVGLIAPLLSHSYSDYFHAAVQSHGMITRPWWQHSPAIHRLHGEGIRNAVHVMMRLPRDDRPDGLILADDNQVEDATTGLIAAGVRVPDEIKVVAHTNFPWPTEAHVPVIRVGFDTTRVLHLCGPD